MIVIQGPFDTHKELFSADLSPIKATKCCTAGTGLYCWYRAVLQAQDCIAGTDLNVAATSRATLHRGVADSAHLTRGSCPRRLPCQLRRMLPERPSITRLGRLRP